MQRENEILKIILLKETLWGIFFLDTRIKTHISQTCLENFQVRLSDSKLNLWVIKIK